MDICLNKYGHPLLWVLNFFKLIGFKKSKNLRVKRRQQSQLDRGSFFISDRIVENWDFTNRKIFEGGASFGFLKEIKDRKKICEISTNTEIFGPFTFNRLSAFSIKDAIRALRIFGRVY